jgi:hypothetical protein
MGSSLRIDRDRLDAIFRPARHIQMPLATPAHRHTIHPYDSRSWPFSHRYQSYANQLYSVFQRSGGWFRAAPRIR